MTINLPADLEAYVDQQVQAGAYNSREDVVAHALKLMQEEADRRKRFEEIRAIVQVGINEADRGQLVDGPAAVAELERSLADSPE